MPTFTRSRWLTAACLATATLARETQIPYSYEAAVEANRKLQEGPGCPDSLSIVVTCYDAQCADDICELGDGVAPEPPLDDANNGGCEWLESVFCSSFDRTCCTPCAEQTQAYLDCLVENSYLQLFCPGGSCSDYHNAISNSTGNLTIPNITEIGMIGMGDGTEDPMGTDIPADVGENLAQYQDSWLAGFCGTEIAEVFSCYFNKCPARECDADVGGELEGAEPTTEECSEYNTAFCVAMDNANACCPECAAATAAFSACSLKTLLWPYCPGASCDDASSETAASRTAGEESTNKLRPQGSGATTGTMEATSGCTKSVTSIVGIIVLGLLSLIM